MKNGEILALPRGREKWRPEWKCLVRICLINNLNHTKSLQPLSNRRLVGDLSIFYRYFHGHCSQEIREIIPVP